MSYKKLEENRVKYPRTPHLPWSRTKSSDDKILKSVDHFNGKEVIVTEKMDGENTTLYTDYMHSRSTTYSFHPSRTMVKQIHSNIGHLIPNGWRICGENMYARHSIPYDSLEGYFLMFSVWDQSNISLSWDEVVEWSCLLNLPTVPVLYDGVWEESLIKKIHLDENAQEGYVVRLKDNFHYDDFSKSVAKYVRENHVRTDSNWMHTEIVPNSLIDNQ